MVIIDPKEGVRFGTVKNLDDMYRIIGCDTIDIVTRNVCGKPFDFIIDDEGLLKADPQVSAIWSSRIHAGDIEPALVGVLIICSHDREGNTIDISLDDHMLLCDRLTKLLVKDRNGNISENTVIRLDDWRW